MPRKLGRTVRLIICTTAVSVWALSASPAFAQWYRTYDDALRAFGAGDLVTSETKLKESKKQAEAVGRRPGRSVLRYGGLREPFIPDYWLGQIYSRLADGALDTVVRATFHQQALNAFGLAASSGQVRERDPEYAALIAATEKARAELPETSARLSSEIPTPPKLDPLNVVRDEIRRLVDTGDQALANRSWDTAEIAFQDASRRLDAAPSLRGEFGLVAIGLAETTLARQIETALEHLNAGRYTAARNAFEQISRSSGVRPSLAALRAMVAEIPQRLTDARLGETITAGDTAYRTSRWALARDAYEAAQRQAQGSDIATSRVRESYAQIPGRLKQTNVNLAIDEARFSDALTIDPRNPRALAGEYDRGLVAYKEGRWADAARSFELLSSLGGGYRDSRERTAAAEMQVEFAAGVAAQATNPQTASSHYVRVQELKASITGPLAGSDAVVTTAENAANRVRRINADDAVKNAQLDYDNGQWDRARSNVELVLNVFPGDVAATELSTKLKDLSRQQMLRNLTDRAQAAWDTGDLSTASEVAGQLLSLAPSNMFAREMQARVDLRHAEQDRRRWWFAAGVGAVSIGPLFLISRRRRGRFLAAVGRPSMALKLYDRVLSLNPTDRAVLQRASELATTSGLEIDLDSYFDQYLRARPGDTAIARAAADYFWAKDLRPRAVDLYLRLVTIDSTSLSATTYQRLSAYFTSGIPPSALVSLEQGVRGTEVPAELVLLVAREYARRERIDQVALHVYQLAQIFEGQNQQVRRMTARALLSAGRPLDAVLEAEAAVQIEPHDDGALDDLYDSYVSGYSSAPFQVVHRLEHLKIPFVMVILLGERFADHCPIVRASMESLYTRLLARDRDPAVEALVQGIIELNRHSDIARAKLDAAYVSRGQSIWIARALIQGYRRYLEFAEAQGRPPESDVQVRIAELYTDLCAWEPAIAAWQQIVSMPEFSRRSMAAIEGILASLDLRQYAHAYFVTAGWTVAPPDGDGQNTHVSFLITPGSGVHPDLLRRFQNMPVFCHASVMSVDEVVTLKRVLSDRSTGSGCIAFLITAFAVRHDVYALLYAFMTESPAVTFIPIDGHAIREAIIEGRTRLHLERTLHQWLGHTDIYETHNPVANAATFFGRGQFLHRLVLKISRGENFGIFGLRKIGKTSLVYRLRDFSRDHLVAYVDLQGIASRHTDEVYARLMDSLWRDIRTKYPDMALPPPASLLAKGEANVAALFHKDLVTILRAFEESGRQVPYILLLLDEIELLIPQDSSSGFAGYHAFLRHIRGLYQQERVIVSAVVGAAPAICRMPMLGGLDNPVFQFYDEVFLTSLDPVDCNRMVQGLGELMGVRFDIESLAVIYMQTAGHPYVTRQLCSRLVKLFQGRPLDVTTDMVTAAVDQYLAQSGDYFAGILEGYLDDVSRRVVETLASDGDGGSTRLHILARVEELGVGRHAGDQALGDLELTGLIRRDGDRYKLCIPLLLRWLRRSWLDLDQT